MEVFRKAAGVYAANCYLCYEGDKGFVVDPGGSPDKIIEKIDELGFKPEFILLTHGHADHIAGLDPIRDHYKIPALVHEDDEKMLADKELNLSVSLPSADTSTKADKTFKDGDIIDEEGFKIRVIHTPGHTAGSSCFIVDGQLFTGDTLFMRSCGRSDLPTSDPDAMVKSLERINKIEGDLRIHPGHNAETNLEDEKKYNPFLLDPAKVKK